MEMEYKWSSFFILAKVLLVSFFHSHSLSLSLSLTHTHTFLSLSLFSPFLHPWCHRLYALWSPLPVVPLSSLRVLPVCLVSTSCSLPGGTLLVALWLVPCWFNDFLRQQNCHYPQSLEVSGLMQTLHGWKNQLPSLPPMFCYFLQALSLWSLL